MKKTAMLVVLVIALLGAFTATTAVAETNVSIVNGALVVREIEARETMRVPGVPGGVSAEGAYKLVTGEAREIPILHSVKAKRDAFSWPGFFYITPVQEHTQVAIYDPGKQTITKAEKKGEVYGERQFAIHIVFLFVTIVAMVGSNILFSDIFALISTIAALISAFLISASALAAITYISAIALTFIAFAIAVLAAISHAIAKKLYKVFSVIFYVVAIFVMFV